MSTTVKIGDIAIGASAPLVMISGPCVLEDRDTTFRIAEHLKVLTDKLEIPFIFKASYDKANRTSINAYRGPGMERGLEILSEVKSELGLPVISDVHGPGEVAAAAEVLDIIQIPAFLCRQTDLILAVSKTGKPVNIKKGQFMAPWDIAGIVGKAQSTGNRDIVITDRGTSFGYNNLVADMRGIPVIQKTCPVIFDATHSVQLPGGQGESSGGQREFAPVLARAAVASGADGIFLEVHPDPDRALCDGPNSLKLDELERLFFQLKEIDRITRCGG